MGEKKIECYIDCGKSPIWPPSKILLTVCAVSLFSLFAFAYLRENRQALTDSGVSVE